jgi:hypothetical protein
MKSHTATANWKSLQLKFLDADDIACDYKLKVYMRRRPNWKFHVEYSSPDLKLYSAEHCIVDHEDFDFFIVNDLEFGKLNLNKLENTIRELHDKSRHGGYFSVQSYFLNWNNEDQCRYCNLSDDIDQAVVEWVEQYIGVKNYTNQSLKISNPLSNITEDGKLLAGSDFMYTHGNIRFWLWKE